MVLEIVQGPKHHRYCKGSGREASDYDGPNGGDYGELLQVVHAVTTAQVAIGFSPGRGTFSNSCVRAGFWAGHRCFAMYALTPGFFARGL